MILDLIYFMIFDFPQRNLLPLTHITCKQTFLSKKINAKFSSFFFSVKNSFGLAKTIVLIFQAHVTPDMKQVILLPYFC